MAVVASSPLAKQATRQSTPSNSDNTDTSIGRSNCKRIPSQEWEKKRPIITRLYQQEKKSLKEVMEILEREHNFTATVKMYKSRILKWGLYKKLKSDQVLTILILKAARDAQDKPCEFTIRGQPVDLDNINRYIRRNPSLIARFLAGEVPNVRTTVEVQCHMPLASAQIAPLTPSDTKLVEEILSLFRKYVESGFAKRIWDFEYNHSCKGCMKGDRIDNLFKRVMTSLALVKRSMMRKDVTSISSILNPTFEYLKEVITSESLIFVARTACLLWYLDCNYKNDLFRIIIDYIAGLVPIILDRENPMVRIWEILSSYQFTEYSKLALWLYSTLIPMMEERIGPANFLTTVLYGDHIDCLLGSGRFDEALACATKYRARIEATGMQHPWLIELATVQTAMLCKAKEAKGKDTDAIGSLKSLNSHDKISKEQQAMSTSNWAQTTATACTTLPPLHGDFRRWRAWR
ncbi:Clr5 domain-containing protein [Mariannaea sp. PMI_226]|nr:Clr5 domain-containing protein [Mariannaea sp. PMI_226]